MSNNNVTAGTLEYRQFIILEDGTEIRVRYNQNPELYKNTNVPVYSYQAKEGKGDTAKEVTRYAVPFDQAIRAGRVSLEAKVASMKSQGMSADEILALLVK